MKIKSFDDNKNLKIKRASDQDNLYDLFQKNITFDKSITLKIFIVPREFEMRLDRISNHIYGSPDYVEELMVINDIINPYSVKEGQYIYFCDMDSLNKLYTKDDMLIYLEKNRMALITSAQNNRDKKNVSVNQNLPPTIKSSALQQIKVTSDNKVQIINSFE